jgi:hypothetical protein
VSRPRISDAMADLPLRAAYPLRALANAASMDRRTLRRILDHGGVRCFKTETSVWVPLSELELKVPALWESIKAAEMLRRLVEEDAR